MCLKKNVFHKKINKKVNKQNIRNSENWLLDDVSEIQIEIKFYAKGQIKSESVYEIIDFPKYHQNILIDFCPESLFRLGM
jgi:hypothetical protein